MTLALIALAGAFATATPGQSTGACVLALARSLEPSGEEAGAVAEAAVAGCISTETPAAPNSLFASLPPEQQVQTISAARAMERGKALLYVVRIRACRKTVGCDAKALQE